MEPGPDPYNNRTFMLNAAAIIRGVGSHIKYCGCFLLSLDLHQDLVRYSISGASNDHRLGGHEVTPS